MKLNNFIVPLGIFILVTGSLYLFGQIFKIELLTFHQHHTETPEGFTSETRSLLPFIVGLGTSYIAEKIYLSRKYDLPRKN